MIAFTALLWPRWRLWSFLLHCIVFFEQTSVSSSCRSSIPLHSILFACPVSGGYYKARTPTTHETTIPQIESAAPAAPVKAALDAA